MNKKIPMLTLMGAFVVGIASACGPTDNRINITFWHTLGKANEAMLNDMIDEFEELYPEYRVSASSQGGYDELRDKILNTISVGTNPDMAFCYPDHVARYLESDSVIDMTPYVNDPEVGFAVSDGSHEENGETIYGSDDFIQGYWEEGTEYSVEGLYSVPYAKSTEVLFYNKDVFEANGWPVPTKWFNDEDPDDLTAMFNLCREIFQEMYDDPGFVAPLGYDSDSNLFITLHHQMGIPYTQQADTPEDRYPFLTSQASKDLVTRLKTIYDDSAVAGDQYEKHMFVTKETNGGSYTSTLFTEERCYMSIGSTGGTSYNVGSFNIGIAKIPQHNGSDPEHRGVISQGPSICFFNTMDDETRDGAWLFYRHITNATNSARYAIQTGYEPVRISSYETEQYVEHIAEPTEITGDNLFKMVARLTRTMQEDYFSSPVFPGTDRARDLVGGILSNVLLGTETVDDAYSRVYSELMFQDQ